MPILTKARRRGIRKVGVVYKDYNKDNSIRLLVPVESEDEREYLLAHTTPEERRAILLAAIAAKRESN